MMLGMKKTSPAIASAMSNLAPGLIFIVAVCLSHVAASIVSVPCRLEKFEVEYWYSRAKVGETFVCFSGSVAMSCFRSNSNSPNLKSKEPKLLMKHLDKDTYSDWILGCFYLLAAVVLQLQGGAMVGVCIALQMWCLNRKGPPLVAIFSPIQTLCAASYSFSHPLRADHKFRKVGSGIQF
ncbi:WAT1-related protein At5g47470-like [Musa acuminata AAA Group]|uniref:WAT1-related protein At5g47470-like n=1 Tax=Musa acuminata AAA Group TaxID=214697 RepID=UPI0031D06A4E